MAVSSTISTFARVFATSILCNWIRTTFAAAQDGMSLSFGANILQPRDPPVMTANATVPSSVEIRREPLAVEDRQLNLSWWHPGLPMGTSTTADKSSGRIAGNTIPSAEIDTSAAPYPLVVFLPPCAGSHDEAYYFLPAEPSQQRVITLWRAFRTWTRRS